MFKRGSKYDGVGELRAAGDAVRYGGTGSTVVFRSKGATVAVNLESSVASYTGTERQIGPADTLAVALADILRHLTGTPTAERSAPAPSAQHLEDARLEAQADLLTYLQGVLDVWQSGNSGTTVVSHQALSKLYGNLLERSDGGEHIKRTPL